jgi:exonuclease SbcD
MKFIHCSDLHIDSPLRGLERYEGAPVEAMRVAPRAAMKNIVELAIDNKVDLVAIAGDIFDGDWRDFNTGLFFTSQLSRLAANNIPVVLIKGNHDAASEISKSLRMPSNVTVFNHRKPEIKRFDDIGIAVHGQSFADRSVQEDLAQQYLPAVKDMFNLALLHTSLGGYAQHDPYAPTTLDILRSKGYDYWALGHIHARQVISEMSPRVVYCGNSQGRDARELGPKGCELVTVEGGQITAEFVPSDAVRWVQIELDITGLNDLDALLDAAQKRLLSEVGNAGGRVLATRFHLVGSSKVHSTLVSAPETAVAELRNMVIECSDGNAWMEKIKQDTRPVYDESRDDPMGELVRLVTRLGATPTELQTLASGSIGSLLEKLPLEVREELKLTEVDELRAVLRDAEAQVLGRLRDST